MAVERIEWQCPGCHRKFAIPSNQPRPKLCPHCQQTAQAIPRQPTPSHATAAYVSPAIVEPEVEFAEETLEVSPHSGISPSYSPRGVKRRRYEILRTISLWFKILSALIAIGVFSGLVDLGIQILDSQPGFERKVLIYGWFGTLISGLTLVLLVYAFAVLLLVAMDIEHNTRQD